MTRRKWNFRALVLTAMVVSGGLVAESSADPSRQIGNSWEYELQGNPSTGYQWEVDEAKSEGLAAVKIEAQGYRSAKKTKLVGAPAQFVFRITCVAIGSAHIQFNYVAPDKQSIGAVHENWVNCQ